MTLLPEQIQHMVETMTKNQRQAWLQQKGYEAWLASDCHGTMEMATGTGKTRIGVTAIAEELLKNPQALIYVIVPTETLRDVDWPKEMKEAGYPDMHTKVRMLCYASLPKEKPERDIDLIVLDEVHHLTQAGYSVFTSDNHQVWKVLGLTATLPGTHWQQDIDKNMLINSVCPSCFKIPLELAIALKIVTDFEMYVLKFDLDAVNHNVSAGSAKKPYKTTEANKYYQLTKMMQRATYTKNEGLKFMAISRRTEFLYNLETKKKIAIDVIKQIMNSGERTLMFFGSIAQSKEICGEQVYNSESSDDMLNAFINEEINYLGVVQALNEGKNLPNIDQILIVQLNSKELNLIQRIGRAIRWKDGHTPKVIVLVAKGTADERWYNQAIKNFDKSRIKEFYVKPST